MFSHANNAVIIREHTGTLKPQPQLRLCLLGWGAAFDLHVHGVTHNQMITPNFRGCSQLPSALLKIGINDALESHLGLKIDWKCSISVKKTKQKNNHKIYDFPDDERAQMHMALKRGRKKKEAFLTFSMILISKIASISEISASSFNAANSPVCSEESGRKTWMTASTYRTASYHQFIDSLADTHQQETS